MSNKNCVICNKVFSCTSDKNCWCMNLSIKLPIPTDNSDCLCPDCIEKKASEPLASDYYYENGFMVMTASYLLKRGYCCQNGCRHCPY